MPRQRITVQIDDELLERLKEVAAAEGKDAEEIVALGLRAVLNMAPVARETLRDVERGTSPSEQAYVSQALSRQVIVAHMHVLETRAVERFRAKTAETAHRSEQANVSGPKGREALLAEYEALEAGSVEIIRRGLAEDGSHNEPVTEEDILAEAARMCEPWRP